MSGEALHGPESPGARAGFTLIELIVATLLLAVGILAMASVMASISAQRQRVTSRIEMTTLAESKFEELRARSHAGNSDTVQLAVGGSLTTSLPDHADTVTAASGRPHVRRWTVEDGPAGARAVTLRLEPLNRSRFMLPGLEFEALVLVIP